MPKEQMMICIAVSNCQWAHTTWCIESSVDHSEPHKVVSPCLGTEDCPACIPYEPVEPPKPDCERCYEDKRIQPERGCNEQNCPATEPTLTPNLDELMPLVIENPRCGGCAMSGDDCKRSYCEEGFIDGKKEQNTADKAITAKLLAEKDERIKKQESTNWELSLSCESLVKHNTELLEHIKELESMQ